jgi:hypothetical protein
MVRCGNARADRDLAFSEQSGDLSQSRLARQCRWRGERRSIINNASSSTIMWQVRQAASFVVIGANAMAGSAFATKHSISSRWRPAKWGCRRSLAVLFSFYRRPRVDASARTVFA